VELHDYLAALRRHWRTWVAVAAASVLAAIAAVAVLPRTYVATAQVFVASTSESTAGFQFVTQRVKSYLDVADSPAVLERVIEDLDLDESLATLRQDVSATNPADTSQVNVSVVSSDPQRAADTANAAARRFATVVEELETPENGSSPVRLTVTGPASAPTSPEDPKPLLLLTLGLVVGLCLGVAAAVVRYRTDTSLHTPDDVRRAWGADVRVPLLSVPAGRARRSRLTGRPAASLARRLETLAEDGPLRVLLLASTADGTAAHRLAAEVAEELRGAGTTAAVTGGSPTAVETGDRRARVHLSVGDPLFSLRDRRRLTSSFEAVVLVLEDGRVDGAELRELRDMLEAVGVTPLSLVLLSAARGRQRAGKAPDVTAPAPGQPAGQRRPDAVGAGRA
jgi:capsular polysaccharide biosynthesis protein